MEKLELKSGAFQHGGVIPDLYTCRGRNISPPLCFGGVPKGSVTHWVVYNIPPDFRELAQGVPPGKLLENGVHQGRNGMFRLFALDRLLQPKTAINRRKLLRLVEAGDLAEATLIGYYPGKGA
jgi:phosphatidylethanolamine-binding protein (PEBP) family uncharacterized protein